MTGDPSHKKIHEHKIYNPQKRATASTRHSLHPPPNPPPSIAPHKMIFPTIAHFLGGVAAAIVVKLASSIDDVLWLSAFLTPSFSKPERTKNAITYSLICLLQTGLAFILSQFGSSVIDDIMGGSDDQRMSTDRLLTLVSGGALFIYSIVLGVEYYQENFAEEYKPVLIATTSSSDVSDDGDRQRLGDGEQDENSTDSDVEAPEVGTNGADAATYGVDWNGSGESPLQSKDEEEESDMKVVPLEIGEATEDDHEEVGTDYSDSEADKKPRSLAIIAFLGSLDDLTLFVPMLVGKTFGIVELMVGAMLSAFFIVVLCVCLTQCKAVARVLEKIPLVAIVATFSVILLTKGIFLMR